MQEVMDEEDEEEEDEEIWEIKTYNSWFFFQ